MEYRINFCWENPARDFHIHIISIPWNEKNKACFPESDLTYINEKLAQGTTPGVPVTDPRILCKLAYLYTGVDSYIYDKLQLVCDHVHAKDNVIAWIEREDQHELGEPERYKTMYEIRLGDKCYVKDVLDEDKLQRVVPTHNEAWYTIFGSRLHGLKHTPISLCIERLIVGAWYRAYEGTAKEKEVSEACAQLLKDCPNNVPELRFWVYNMPTDAQGNVIGKAPELIYKP